MIKINEEKEVITQLEALKIRAFEQILIQVSNYINDNRFMAACDSLKTLTIVQRNFKEVIQRNFKEVKEEFNNDLKEEKE